MAQFEYIAKDSLGKKKKGRIVADTKRLAYEKLKKKELRVIEIQEKESTFLQTEISIHKSVKRRDFVIFLRQFATLIRAGIPIFESINILAQQTNSKALKHALFQIEENVASGSTVSQACSKFPKIFPEMFISLLKAGEISGTIDSTLDRMAFYYERQHKTRKKIQSAMAYPIAVGVIAVIVVIFLLVKVVPTFVDMYEDFGSDLPAVTQFVLDASDWMQTYWWMILLLLLSIYTLFKVLYKNSKGKYYIDYAVLKMPVFGSLMRKNAMARMSRTFSSLIASNISILHAIGIVESVVNNEVIGKVLNESKRQLEKGERLITPMENHWAFPPLVTQMIAIGEQSGYLDSMLAKVADFYEDDVEATTEQMKSLIEPLMIVLLAGVVGVIVAAILVPMYGMYENIG